MIYFICIIHFISFTGTYEPKIDLLPSGFIAQLVERRTGIARSRVQAPLKSWIFFRRLYAIAKIAIITARIILHLKMSPIAHTNNWARYSGTESGTGTSLHTILASAQELYKPLLLAVILPTNPCSSVSKWRKVGTEVWIRHSFVPVSGHQVWTMP